jgi:hypothetical protein
MKLPRPNCFVTLANGEPCTGKATHVVLWVPTEPEPNTPTALVCEAHSETMLPRPYWLARLVGRVS